MQQTARSHSGTKITHFHNEIFDALPRLITPIQYLPPSLDSFGQHDQAEEKSILIGRLVQYLICSPPHILMILQLHESELRLLLLGIPRLLENKQEGLGKLIRRCRGRGTLTFQ